MPSNTDTLASQVNILIDGRKITPELVADFLMTEIAEDIDVPSMFELKFVTWDLAKQKITWVDDDLFQVGREVEIQMGYEKNIKSIIIGEITGLEPEFPRDQVPILRVRGHDLRHRLLRGHQTQSFVKMKDSEIASKIAREKGLTPQVNHSKTTLDYVLQHNQTDWDFLKSRAERIGYEIFIEKKTLYFRPQKNDQAKILTLTYSENLLDFLPRLSSLNQVEKIEVTGWIPKEKNSVLGQAGSGQENSKMGGSKTGADAVKSVFKSSVNRVIAQPVTSKAEADQIALGQFQNRAIDYITAEGSCLGNPDLQVGKVIEIQGVGKKFTGLYYVVKTLQRWSLDEGYHTFFTARRTAI